MTDITPQQVAEAGPDAIALMLALMQRNERESAALTRGLYDSAQRNLEEARAEIARIRRNVSIVLRSPHTDAMVGEALFAGRDYPDPEACE